MTDDRDPPIEEQGYTMGVNVVDIGDLRVARGMTRRPQTTCRHRKLVYDNRERRIWCSDCETNVEAFDAFERIAENFDNAHRKADRLLKEAHEASKFALISRAAKTIDKEWRSRKMVPTCPHCSAGLWPEDALRMGSVNREWDAARRKKALAQKGVS
ncbi:hypothetical protein ACSMXM_05740 [Pacificimonas sp. ICDLI1SI03]